MRAKAWVAVMWGVSASCGLLGCSSNPAAGEGCVQGRVASCDCGNGVGVQSCQVDNTFGLCDCSRVTPSQAGARAGTGGVRASGGVGGATAGASATAGRGGMTAIAGNNSGGSSAGRGTAGAVVVPPPYNACSAMAPCSAPATCTFAMPGSPTGYCSPQCMANRQCERPISGNVRATCNVANACVLGTCQRMSCPDGMVCVQSMSMPFGMMTTYSCVYPAK